MLDAARLDGAGWWNRLFKIIIPLLVPAIAYFVLTNVIWIFVGLFALVFTVTKGGPGYATTPFDLVIYRKAFESGELGYASAALRDPLLHRAGDLCRAVADVRPADHRCVNLCPNVEQGGVWQRARAA
ncbi:MAG: ABC transporter permease subunit [Thermomicrobiales bacterium]